MKEKLKVWSKKWWFWVIVVVLVFAIIGSFGEDSKPSTNNTQTIENKEDKQEVIFLEGTNSDDFVSVLSSVTGITDITGTEIGDSITYAKSSDKYSISVDADKTTKKIDYVRVICLTDEDPTNVFMSFNRMNYIDGDAGKFTDWLTKNIGKTSSLKIGNANYELSLSTSNKPILLMKSDGSDKYMEEQIDKATN